ncbi:MAG: prolipoprotein diacylglyceryl transferase [Kiritimatiellia bacterium]
MHQICFYIGSRPIYWYGVMVALGFLLATAHWSWLARRSRLPQGFGSNLAFFIMISGILGARVAYVLANIPYFAKNPLHIFRVDEGGLVFYGGFFGALIAVIIMARVQKMPVWALGDLAITGVPLGHALGRVGCFLNGCCYGIPTGCPLGVRYPAGSPPDLMHPGLHLHPVQLYETAGNLALYSLLLWLYLRGRKNGTTVALYFILYPLLRFGMEFFRGDERLHGMGLTVAQLVSAIMLVAGIIIMILRYDKPGMAHAQAHGQPR